VSVQSNSRKWMSLCPWCYLRWKMWSSNVEASLDKGYNVDPLLRSIMSIWWALKRGCTHVAIFTIRITEAKNGYNIQSNWMTSEWPAEITQVKSNEMIAFKRETEYAWHMQMPHCYCPITTTDSVWRIRIWINMNTMDNPIQHR
jgi:hypothetical protein